MALITFRGEAVCSSAPFTAEEPGDADEEDEEDDDDEDNDPEAAATAAGTGNASGLAPFSTSEYTYMAASPGVPVMVRRKKRKGKV